MTLRHKGKHKGTRVTAARLDVILAANGLPTADEALAQRLGAERDARAQAKLERRAPILQQRINDALAAHYGLASPVKSERNREQSERSD